MTHRIVGATWRDFAGPHETSSALNHLDVPRVRRMEFVRAAKQVGADDVEEVDVRTYDVQSIEMRMARCVEVSPQGV